MASLILNLAIPRLIEWAPLRVLRLRVEYFFNFERNNFIEDLVVDFVIPIVEGMIQVVFDIC